jgi:hypothetical protein
MAGSPVPLARSKIFIAGFGRAYSTNASVTSRPMAADFAFHFSAAASRDEALHSKLELGSEFIQNKNLKPRIRVDQHGSVLLSSLFLKIRGRSF